MMPGSSSAGRLGHYPPAPESIPRAVIQQGRYRVRFATTEEELDAILRLRFEVFNLELGEGLESSYETGRDEDPFDLTCHHLLVEDVKGEATVVGTYRMQTSAMAAEGGFYSAGEFDLSALPPKVVDNSVEIGRACIAREHRNRQILYLLWKGLASYMSTNEMRYLFGCCSLSSQDGCEGLRVLRYLEEAGRLHPEVRVPPLPGLECRCEEALPPEAEAVELPILFRTYLRYGALVCGPPAVDREFKTIDFLVLFDVEAMEPRTYHLFFD